MVYFKFCIGIKQINHLLTLLVAGIWGLLFPFFCQFLFQATLTITMHRRLVPVLAKVLSYEILVGIVLPKDHNLVKGLQQNACKGQYSYQFLQVVPKPFI